MVKLNGLTLDLGSVLEYSGVAAMHAGKTTRPEFPDTFVFTPKVEISFGEGINAITVSWLPYLAGFTTVVPITDRPVMTGKMSGCPLVLFTIGGAKYLAHIGTSSEYPEKSEAAKEAWYKAAETSEVSVIRAWSPPRDFNVLSIRKVLGDLPQIFGGADSTGKAFSIICMSEVINGRACQTGVSAKAAKTIEGKDCVRALLSQ